jgi:branched-chain amino acid transport system ATP-binding protein
MSVPATPSTAPRYVLQADDVAIHYGGVKALDGVSLTLEKGQIRGLIGPNGAGKSTVIDAMTGRRRLTRGRVRIQGQDVTELDVVGRRRLGLSRSFQRTSVFAQMRVRQQVELASHKMGVTDSAADADAVLAELDLLSLAEVTAEDLGYGEQRRLDLALALVGRPQVLLLDEPMAGLSVKESHDLAQHLKSLISRWSVSVLLVEHDMDVVFGISDEITVFELGRVIASGKPAEVRANPRVREAYLGSQA